MKRHYSHRTLSPENFTDARVAEFCGLYSQQVRCRETINISDFVSWQHFKTDTTIDCVVLGRAARPIVRRLFVSPGTALWFCAGLRSLYRNGNGVQNPSHSLSELTVLADAKV